MPTRTIRRNDPADQYPERVDPSSPEYVARAIRMTAILATKASPTATAEELRDVLEALGLIERLKPSVSVVKTFPGPVTPKPAADGSTGDSAPVPAPRKSRGPRDTSLCGKRRHAMTGDNVRIREDGRRRCRACATDWAGGKRTLKIERPRSEPVDPGPRMCGSGTHPLPDGGECKQCKNDRAKRYRAKASAAGAAGKTAAKKSAAEEAAANRRAAAIKHARDILAAASNVEVPPLVENGVPVPRCEKLLHYKVGENLGARQAGTNKVGRCLACDRVSRAKIRLRELAGEVW